MHHPCPDAKTNITVRCIRFWRRCSKEQGQKERWVPLAFFSRKLSAAEHKYSAFDSKLLGAHQAIKRFRHFVEAKPLQYIPITNLSLALCRVPLSALLAKPDNLLLFPTFRVYY